MCYIISGIASQVPDDVILTLARFPYFATFASAWGSDPPDVSNLSVVELSGKTADFSDEYSGLVVRFPLLGQNLTQLWEVKGQIFEKSIICQVYMSISQQILIEAT